MKHRALSFVSAVALSLGATACPVTDDYYLLPMDVAKGQGGDSSQAGTSIDGGAANPAGTDAGGVDRGGSAQAGSATGGASAGSAGDAAMGGTAAGTADAGQAGMPPGEGGGAGSPNDCVPTTERCNGHDDDCDESVDEFVCQSNCSGFVLTSDPNHGYMFCTGARKANFATAKKACEDQDMRLAWLTSAEENQAVAQRLDSLGSDAEVLFGATDQGNEGDWLWVEGAQFWRGNEYGQPVGGLYNSWAMYTPNNSNNEDCALLIVDTGKWGDRTCNATYPFLCEQPD